GRPVCHMRRCAAGIALIPDLSGAGLTRASIKKHNSIRCDGLPGQAGKDEQRATSASFET
ncbi:MAG: hypothetical protein ACJ8FM_21440, partial [Xanthobacteraceae bacterium]